jgi:hypothetical protein
MAKSKERHFILVYQTETDGAIHIASKTKRDIQAMTQYFPDDAFAIFDGRCLKTFDAKFDIGRIRDSS